MDGILCMVAKLVGTKKHYASNFVKNSPANLPLFSPKLAHPQPYLKQHTAPQLISADFGPKFAVRFLSLAYRCTLFIISNSALEKAH